MKNRTKTALFMFVDYLLCILLQMFGLFVLSWTLQFPWGYPAYSAIFSLILFGLLYSRAHKAAKRDSRLKENQPGMWEGLRMAIPLAVLNLVIILAFALIEYNVVPVRDLVIKTIYRFPDNAPREKLDVLLIDSIIPFIRVWFGALVGFMKENTTTLILFIMPILNLAAGFLGYYAGRKKFFIADYIFRAKEKMKDKFNE